MIKVNQLPRIVLTILTAAALMGLTACSDSEEPSELMKASEKLTSRTWKIKSVTTDGKDVTSDFLGMTITFSEDTFTTTNGLTIWPSQGAWEFTSQDASLIRRGDQVVISVRELSETSLIVSLQWSRPALAPGRINSIQGTYVFSFQ